MPGISGWNGVVAGHHRVAVADPAVPAMDSDFATPGVPDYVLCPQLGLGLCVVMGAHALSVWCHDVPTAFRVRDNVPTVLGGHSDCPSVRWSTLEKRSTLAQVCAVR